MSWRADGQWLGEQMVSDLESWRSVTWRAGGLLLWELEVCDFECWWSVTWRSGGLIWRAGGLRLGELVFSDLESRFSVSWRAGSLILTSKVTDRLFTVHQGGVSWIGEGNYAGLEWSTIWSFRHVKSVSFFFILQFCRSCKNHVKSTSQKMSSVYHIPTDVGSL